jgi:alkanesulfonate monooxygenase SsuD/methylene tetrahydromethanopterin reductase-like flavin-dependent oxidoreductase (luciferase family)
MSDAALRRVVKHGNGWLAVGADTLALRERLTVLARLAEAAGRRMREFTLAYKMFLSIGAARQGAAVREPGSGSPEEIAADIAELLALGFTTIIVRCRGDSDSVLLGQIERFITDIAPSA